MVQELAEGLVDRGHQITVVASDPRPHLTSEQTEKLPMSATTDKGIKVFRVNTLHYRTSNYLIRGIGELLLPYLFFRKVNQFVRENIDAVVVYSPPLSLSILGRIVKKSPQVKFILNVYDIFPQNAIDLGILRNRVLVRFFEHIENRAYSAADHIRTYSDNHKKFLIERKQVPSHKVSTVYNWIDLLPYMSARPTGIFRTRYGLEGRFILLFAGILGPSQQLDFVIRVAEEVKDIPEICFLIVGGGSEKEKLQKLAEERRLENVEFQPFVPPEDYPSLVKDSDVGLACLSCKNTTPVFPGKLLGFMACAVPIVAFLHRGSDGHHLISGARCGYSTVSDDHRRAADLVRKVFQERETLPLLGRNGFEYARTHFSKETCIDMMEKVIKSA